MFGFKKRRAKVRGFLLIELLAATIILSTALVVISRTFSNSAALLNHAASLLRAEMLLEEKMADFEQEQTLSAGSQEGTFSLPDSFHWSSQIEKRTEPSLYQVALTVSWKEGLRPQSLMVTTLLEKPPETPTP